MKAFSFPMNALLTCSRVLALILSGGVPWLSAAPANSELLHQKLLRGESLTFDENAEESQRTIDAKWIREASLKTVKIDIHGAVIAGVLDLTHATFERPFF